MMRSLLSNLRVRTKMSIAASLLLLPLIFLSLQFFLKTAEDIHSTRLEVAGIHFSAPLFRLTSAVQQRRLAVARSAGGESSEFKTATDALRKAADDTEATQAREKKRIDLEIVWTDLRTKLNYLADTNLKADRVRHVMLHTETIQAIAVFQSLVAEKSQLDLEPEAAGFYLNQLSLHIVTPLIESLQLSRTTTNLPVALREANRSNILFHADQLERNRWRIQNYLSEKKSAYEKRFDEALKLLDDLRVAFSRAATAEKTEAISADAVAAANALFTTATDDLQAQLESRASTLRIKQLTVLFLAAIGALLSGLVGWFIMKQISRSLDEAMQISERLASGNLEFEINANTHDEIGAFMNSLQIMAERLRGVLRQVHQGASEIALAAQQVSSTAEMLNNGAMDQAAHVEETGAALGEMVNLIQSNAKNAVETDNTANMAVKNTQMGTENVLRAVESMKVISERIQIVQEIAAQTNLLALNATIEAARAGEHGRGFAVVATEVGKLAETSGQAAKQIQALLRDSSAVSENAASSLSLITESMQNTAQKVLAIRHASEEQNQAAQQISETMGRLNQTTEQTASAAEELAATAEEMSSQTATLIEGLKFFSFANEGAAVSHGYSAVNTFKQAIAKKTARTAPGANSSVGSEPMVIHSGSYEKF
ncbi:methyl-accepting chemotaxis protein [Turneriella parva]|uniref:Methyl-accepting chemotaxis sensory transducer n=1 Tax=Turneriella parva (strain ATCC BAA-1111 / DSM 21527 / NCTC 11395 / H) TaxID=869212 RepID=I4B1B9_TURPD|nr:methyl-accepting chemotaxis protein [Turneriella parva]AFM11076.1 methyl-accepting chemotaxis sensory transducer [Turneriella parva DSM 21527]